MVELIGDVCQPSMLLLPRYTTAEADAMSGATTLSGAPMLSGQVIFNTTVGKAEVFLDSGWETITSVAR